MPTPAGRWSALALIAAAQVGAMSTWFSAAAIAPALAQDWRLSASQLALLTVGVQIGFVLGALALALSGIADVVSSRRLFAVNALLAAAANAILPAAAGNLLVAVPLRFALGVCLAGVYPVGMKLMAGWFREGRGLAIGALVGALTLGSAIPYLVAGISPAGTLHWKSVIVATSAGAVLSAGIVAGFVRVGPFEAPTARLDLGWAIRSWRHPAIRLANFGYFGHMWELYAMWTWLPVFLIASFQASGSYAGDAAGRAASLATAAAIATGTAGCIVGGVVADRAGRTFLTAAAMAVSGASALATGLLYGRSPGLVIAIAVVWGASVIADSAQFSTAISELAEPQRVGSALALQTSLGFLLTAVSIQLVPFVLRAAGWPGAFAALSLGPMFGIVAMLRLRARPEAVRLAGGRR